MKIQRKLQNNYRKS